MRRVILLISLLTFFTFANTLEDKAFEAYKNKEYVESFKQYTNLAKSNNIKSFLMLGLFFEKGIGVEPNREKAIKLYKHLLRRTSNIKHLVKSKDYKKINITIAALKRLYALTNSEEYSKLIYKIQELKKPESEVKDKLFSSSNNENVDDFLILCPNAKVIAPEDREGLEEFDCALFEFFPNKMAEFMKLRRLKFAALDNKDKQVELNAKISKVIKPLIEYLQHEVVSCYAAAESKDDILSCNYDYLAKTDPLLFRDYSYSMEQYMSKNSFKNHILDSFEKEDLVDKLVAKIANGTFGENWKSMVK
jgi:hypothetical protein